MVFFGHHRHQQSRLQQQEAALARKARNPYGLGNSAYRDTTATTTTRRHPYEVDADGDIDDLCEQEIHRYEELFENSNRGGFGGLNDDDTLNDQSIYTSTPTLQGPPSSARSLRPSGLRNQTKQEQDSEEEEQEEESMWGLEDPYKFSAKPAPTSLLTPQEEAAAAKLGGLKKKKAKAVAAQKSNSKPPTSSIPAKYKTKNTSKESNREIQKTHKKKPLFFPKRFFNRQASQKSCATPASKPSSEVASKNSKQQQQIAFKTPKTHASTPFPPNSTTASKKKFFASPSRLFPAKKNKLHKPERQRHPNLLLASFSATAANNKNNSTIKHPSPPSPSMNVRGNSASYVPPASSSPPPPMDDFDVCSVISAQSSLTDAHDAWMISNSPPQIIGGDHLQQCAPQEYEGNDLSPLSGGMPDGDADDDGAEAEDVKANEVNASIESPAAVRLTKEGLFHHDTQISTKEKEPCQKSSSSSPSSPTDLVKSVRAVKEQREKRKEEKAQLYEDIDPEDADMHVVQILGLHNVETEEDGSRSKQSSQVKRKLFGSQSDDASIQMEVEKEAGEEKSKKTTMAAQPDKYKESSIALKTSTQPNDYPKVKSSRFRKFFSKFVHSNNGNPNQKISYQEWLEHERARVQEAENEKERLEHEEFERIQRKKEQELERQRKLHLVESNSTAEETSNPISSSSRAGTPASTSSPSLCVHCQSNDRTHIVLPCMHYTLCDDCVEQSRQADSCHCLTCDTAGFLYARVGVLEGPELQEKLLQQSSPTKAAAATVQALAFHQ